MQRDDDLRQSAMRRAASCLSDISAEKVHPAGGYPRKGAQGVAEMTPLPQAVELQHCRGGEPDPEIFHWQTGP
jgi:hypothetical protein